MTDPFTLKDPFIVKTSSRQANMLFGGGFRSGEIQTIYASAGSGIQPLLLTAVKDAANHGLKSAYFDFSHNISYEAVKANGLDPDGDLLKIVRRRPAHTTESTLRTMTAGASSMEADFVVLDLSQSRQLRIMDRAWNQANGIGSFSRVLVQLAQSNMWAMVIVLPSTSTHWRPYGTLTAAAGGTDCMTLSRDTHTVTVQYLAKNGIPYAVDSAHDIVSMFTSNPMLCSGGMSRKHSCTDRVPQPVKDMIGQDEFYFYELAAKARANPDLAGALQGLLSFDADSAVLSLMDGKLGVPQSKAMESLEKVKEILTFGGESGNFAGIPPESAAAVVDVWTSSLDSAGVDIDFANVDPDIAMEIGRMLCIDSAVSAAIAGVPVSDILVG